MTTLGLSDPLPITIATKSPKARKVIEAVGLEADRARLAFLARLVSTDWGAKFLPWFEHYERRVAEQERQQDALARARKIAGLA